MNNNIYKIHSSKEVLYFSKSKINNVLQEQINGYFKPRVVFSNGYV